MNATRIGLAILALCIGLAASTLAAAPDSVEPASEPTTAPEITAAEPAPAPPEVPADETLLQPEPLLMSTGIVCTFKCNDGYGFLYDCPDPTFGECCSQAEPACSAHGGLESAICKRGHLGLSCIPF